MGETNEKKNSLMLKLQKMRVELGEKDIKKSGRNEYSKFNYFELSDFLPEINKLMLTHNVTSIYGIADGKATLTFHDLESEQVLVFSIPTAELSIKGAAAIQNIGGLTTYTRRYLYMIAFEIAENDEFDHTIADNNDRDEPPKMQEQIQMDPIPQYIDKVKQDSLKMLMNKKGVEIKSVLERYGIPDLSHMTIIQYKNAMSGLERTPVKREENIDLGL